MKLFFIFYRKNFSQGFSIIEVLFSLAIFSMMLLTMLSIFHSINQARAKGQTDRELQENGRIILDIISSEIAGAKKIYTPTTTASQLSLETTKNPPTGSLAEKTTYVDFFLCSSGIAICMRREVSVIPFAISSEFVRVNSLTFTQISNNGIPSVRVNLSLSSRNFGVSGNIDLASSSINLTSTTALRNY